MEDMTIGQLAKAANVNLETIRYYEHQGMLPVPPRNKSGHRVYSGNGKSLIMERIASEKRAGGCDCAAKNPKGG